MTKAQKIRRGSLLSLGIVTVWFVGVARSISNFGTRDFSQPADCIIVLGAAVNGNQPSPVFRERLRHGVTLQQKGLAPKLLLTGGKGDGQRRSEAEVGEQFALSAGIAPQDLLKETTSRTTQTNLSEARKLMKTHQLQTAIIVSDPLHLKRASLMAKDLQIDAVTSPTPTTRYRSWTTRAGFLLREVVFLHYYWVFGG